MSLGELLKKHRKVTRLTLREASRKLDISVGYLSDMENGRIPRPKMNRIYDLADLYGINIDTICIAATRIPTDAFFKVVRCPALLEVIRNFPEE